MVDRSITAANVEEKRFVNTVIGDTFVSNVKEKVFVNTK
jgi:hypothetical protein